MIFLASLQKINEKWRLLDSQCLWYLLSSITRAAKRILFKPHIENFDQHLSTDSLIF